MLPADCTGGDGESIKLGSSMFGGIGKLPPNGGGIGGVIIPGDDDDEDCLLAVPCRRNRGSLISFPPAPIDPTGEGIDATPGLGWLLEPPE